MINVLGIDEAAKMPVLGSIPVVGVFIDNTDNFDLRKFVDSKTINRKKRALLAKEIKETMKVFIERVTPKEMNASTMNLNDLEMFHVLFLIDTVSSQYPLKKIVIDNFDITEKKFFQRASKFRSEEWIKKYDWIVVHGADYMYKVCSAASIIATNCADEEHAILNEQYGVGSCNPGDKRTETFIKANINELEKWSHIIRLKWSTIERLRNDGKEPVKTGIRIHGEAERVM